MFSHVMLGADDIAASKKFYDACFAALGAKEGRMDPKGRVLYMHNGGIFLLSKPIDGGAACGANGGTIGFAVENEEQGDAGTRRDSPMAAPRSRIRPASARARSAICIWPICAIPRATRSAS